MVSSSQMAYSKCCFSSLQWFIISTSLDNWSKVLSYLFATRKMAYQEKKFYIPFSLLHSTWHRIYVNKSGVISVHHNCAQSHFLQFEHPCLNKARNRLQDKVSLKVIVFCFSV